MKATNLDEFCETLAQLPLTHAQRSLCILDWLNEDKKPSEHIGKTPSELAVLLKAHRLGNPNSTKLRTSISSLKLTNFDGKKVVLKSASRPVIRKWLTRDEQKEQAVVMAQADHFLHPELYSRTRRYIEKTGDQLNGCFVAEYYDAAAVMIRRLAETLIIEAYEFKNKHEEIKDCDGNYLALSKLVDHIVGPNGLPAIGRETKANLKLIKELGDRSAHKRHYIAKKDDIEKLRVPIRLLVEELVSIANLQAKHK